MGWRKAIGLSQSYGMHTVMPCVYHLHCDSNSPERIDDKSSFPWIAYAAVPICRLLCLVRSPLHVRV